MRAECEITLKAENPLGTIDLEHDPDVKQDSEPDRDEDWDEEDAKRVFFGQCVYIEGSDSLVESRRLRVLPAPLVRKIITVISEERVRYFRIRGEEIWAMLWDSLLEAPDPTARMLRILALMGEIVPALGATAPLKRDDHGDHPVRCAFCGALFYLDVDKKCVNCGAAHAGE